MSRLSGRRGQAGRERDGTSVKTRGEGMDGRGKVSTHPGQGRGEGEGYNCSGLGYHPLPHPLCGQTHTCENITFLSYYVHRR